MYFKIKLCFQEPKQMREMQQYFIKLKREVNSFLNSTRAECTFINNII